MRKININILFLFLFYLLPVLIVSAESAPATKCLQVERDKVRGKSLDQNPCSEGNEPTGSFKCCLVTYQFGEHKFQACAEIIDTKKERKEYKKMLKHASNVQIKC